MDNRRYDPKKHAETILEIQRIWRERDEEERKSRGSRPDFSRGGIGDSEREAQTKDEDSRS